MNEIVEEVKLILSKRPDLKWYKFILTKSLSIEILIEWPSGKFKHILIRLDMKLATGIRSEYIRFGINNEAMIVAYKVKQ